MQMAAETRAADTAANEALAHRWHMDLFQAGKLEAADEILAPEFVFHMPAQDVRGPEESRQLAIAFRTAFPDLQIAHEDAVAAGDKVAIRWTARATHRGDFQGVPPTGKTIKMRGIDFFHLRGGKIAEAWIDFDVLGMLQQMGAVAAPGASAAAKTG
jgi:steroid delta-isomerase-like uncharacterized protein